MQLNLGQKSDILGAVSPMREMGAYEALWDQQGASFKKIADLFRKYPNSLPSDHVTEDDVEEYLDKTKRLITQYGVLKFGVRVHGGGEYPEGLRDADHPVEVFYYQGWWDLIYSKSVAVVGTRNPTEDGVNRTRKLVKCLVEDGFTIVSGLAKGVDTIAHTTAISLGGNTIGVIGTPLSQSYPKENARLQDTVRNNFLLISQVPFYRYSKHGPQYNKTFFPQRNITMSAITKATVIVEAGETSGTLIQARAALKQGRKLFILDSCFKNPNITWPKKYEAMGAIRVQGYDDIRSSLV